MISDSGVVLRSGIPTESTELARLPFGTILSVTDMNMRSDGMLRIKIENEDMAVGWTSAWGRTSGMALIELVEGPGGYHYHS